MDNGRLIILETELNKVRQFDLVKKAYLSSDSTLVIVKLRVDFTVGLYHENFLFYPIQGFFADQVATSITKIITKTL